MIWFRKSETEGSDPKPLPPRRSLEYKQESSNGFEREGSKEYKRESSYSGSRGMKREHNMRWGRGAKVQDNARVLRENQP